MTHIWNQITTTTYSVSGVLELGKHAIEKFELARGSIKQIVGLTERIDLVLDIFKDERMVADLSELHNGIVQALDARASILTQMSFVFLLFI